MASAASGLEGLLDLAQHDGVDVRPTLLRVLTDLYTQTPAHTIEDERQYTELALRLIDAVDVPARATLAKRLATYPQAPPRVIARLARDVLEVAEPILKHSAALTPADLKAIAADCGANHAHAIAQRGKAEPGDGVESAATDADMPANAEAVELCELFFGAGAAERRLIATNLEYVQNEPLPPPASMQRADIWRLEWGALKHQTDTVAHELERALGVSAQMACRIVNDELGEPIVVAAKALNVPADVLQRMLLFLNPRIGHSVDRVYELSALYTEITAEAAHRLVAIWRDADPVRRRPGRHETLHWRDAAETARRALSEIARPGASQKDPPHFQRFGAKRDIR